MSRISFSLPSARLYKAIALSQLRYKVRLRLRRLRFNGDLP